MGEEINDSDLLLELKAGRECAFDYIFRKYFRSLCAQAYSYVNDYDQAQSLVQECFIKLWESRDSVDKIKSLSSYLAFMVRNKCIDYIRKDKSLRLLHEKVVENTDSIGSDDHLLASEFEENLIIALATLPERSRLAFEYSRFENLTYKEIAKEMEISVKGVEALISRALKSLCAELKDYLP